MQTTSIRPNSIYWKRRLHPGQSELNRTGWIPRSFESSTIAAKKKQCWSIYVEGEKSGRRESRQLRDGRLPSKPDVDRTLTRAAAARDNEAGLANNKAANHRKAAHQRRLNNLQIDITPVLSPK